MRLMPLNILYKITSPFGIRKHPITRGIHFHNGVDINAPEGRPCLAVADGVIKVSKANRGNPRTGYGYYIVVEHDGFCTLYAHLKKRGLKVGTRVKKGDVIAYTGNTGRSTGAHLHFEVREGVYDHLFWRRFKSGQYKNAVDPENFTLDPKWIKILKEKMTNPEEWITFVNAHKDSDDVSRFLPQFIEKLNN